MPAKRARAAYMKQYRLENGRTKRFRLDFDKDNLSDRFEQAKRMFGVTVDNGVVLSKLLDVFLSTESTSTEKSAPPQDSAVNSSFRVTTDQDAANEPVFLTFLSSIDSLAKTVSSHNKVCPGAFLKSDVAFTRGHCSVITLTCEICKKMLPNWSSSPYMPNHRFLLNYRMAHGYFCSGILPNEFKRFCETVGIGTMSEGYMKSCFGAEGDDYYGATEQEYVNSCRSAVLEEVGLSQIESENNKTEYRGISILTDARHGWRKNASQTDVVCIGLKSHKVLTDEIITKSDDHVAQSIGTERLYDHFDNHPDGPVYIDVHTHDRNMSINKFIRESRPDVKNQN